MCGIIGTVGNLSDQSIDDFRLRRDLLKHRGPDQAGEWLNYDQGVWLGNRRLSIFDLTQASNQPFISDNGNLVLVFNGAIYNYIELREILKLKGYLFKSKGDSEVLLNAYVEWGFECLKYLNGMWAFAIYDQREGSGKEKLFVSRDRCGEKPFYYRWKLGYFEFASELKALGKKTDINLKALNHYLALGYVPGDLCIIDGVNKLLPAQAGVFDFSSGNFKKWIYWKLPSQEYDTTKNIRGEELAEQAWDLLIDSVRLRLRSDVPTGIFLSGGLDSSLITAAAAQVSDQPIKTFTIGVPKSNLDETKHALLVANFFNTNHKVMNIKDTPIDLLDKLSSFVDEPIADSSILPSYLVSRMTSEQVTVALGGDGGDEIYGGYSHYQKILQDQAHLGWIPKHLMNLFGRVGSKLKAGTKGRNFLMSLKQGPLKTRIWGTPYFDLELRKLLFKPEILEEIGNDIDAPERRSLELYHQGIDPVDKLMRMDFKQTLPDDYLVKVDRASMANSLEVRTPFLDYRIVEHSYKSIPSRWKATLNERRRIQNIMAKKYLPKEFKLNRKQGFSIPMDNWMRNVSLERILPNHNSSIFNTNYINDLINGQSKGKTNGARLFSLIMLNLMES